MVYKILSIFLLFIILSCLSKAEGIPEVGLAVGTSQYMGDLNRSNLLYQPSVSGGINFIYNLNTRMGIKTQISYLSLKGNGVLKYIPDNNSANIFNFKSNFIHYQLSYFINFSDYNFKLKKENFTPYFQTGLGMSRALSSTDNAESHVNIIFGPGVKLLIKNRLTLGMEYTFVRAFKDGVDGEKIVNFGDWINNTFDANNKEMKSTLNNVDWYSYLSIVITFKFINFAEDCPAY